MRHLRILLAAPLAFLHLALGHTRYPPYQAPHTIIASHLQCYIFRSRSSTYGLPRDVQSAGLETGLRRAVKALHSQSPTLRKWCGCHPYSMARLIRGLMHIPQILELQMLNSEAEV